MGRAVLAIRREVRLPADKDGACLRCRRASTRSVLLCLSPLVLVCTAGCPAVSNLPAPGRVLTRHEPEFGREYRLYVPSYYRDDRDWPLVVVCHGTKPFDTAKLQLKTWKGLAEREGFLVLAPDLIGTAGGLRPDPTEQIRRQIEDEKTILSSLRAVRAARAIDENRTFITCWSAGGYATIFTGLRHPDLFRALSVYQGNFDAAFVEPCVPFLDRYQPVQIVHGTLDPIDNTQACIDWLRSHDLDPIIVERPGSHRRDPQTIFAVFSDVVRKQPWIRLRVQDDPDDRMRVRFKANTSFEPVRYRWDFGDKQGSADPTPDHRYDKPGLYAVRVALWSSKNRYHIRRIQLQIPRIRIGLTPPATAPTAVE